MAFKFIPADWVLSDELRQWTRSKGLTDECIEDEIESFRDHEFKVAKSRPDACWRNWVKNGKRWGRIETVSMRHHRKPEVISAEQIAEDRRKGQANLDRLRDQSRKLKVV